jgi:hypothetical protein
MKTLVLQYQMQVTLGNKKLTIDMTRLLGGMSQVNIFFHFHNFKQERAPRNSEMSPKSSIILNTYDNGYEKASSPLMRVGSTITTQISSPG